MKFPLDKTRTVRNDVRMGQIRQEIPEDLHRWLRIKAAEEGVSLKDLLVRLLQEAKEREQQ